MDHFFASGFGHAAPLFRHSCLLSRLVALSFELVRQMTAPDFNPQLNLHRAKRQYGSLRMRMEAWAGGRQKVFIDRSRRLMEDH